MTLDQTKFQLAIEKFDAENSRDPNKEIVNEMEYPKELLYAQRMTERLLKFNPDASETVQLAARSQHVCRWTIPREDYPMDRKGYLIWRTELKEFHADKAAGILQDCGYDKDTIDHVKSLIRKEKMKQDADSQLLEDVVCMVFLEFYFDDFAAKHDTEKVISILQKTWRKMSEDGRQDALELKLPSAARQLLMQALEV